MACANVLVVGSAGCGKTALIHHLYELCLQGKFPELGPNCLFLKAETDALGSPRNIKMVFDFLKQAAKERGSKCVLIIDEFHWLGSNVQELLSHIEDPNVMVIGAMTDEDYQTFSKNGVTQAFYSRFQKIPIRLNNEIRITCFKSEFAKIKEAHPICPVLDDFETMATLSNGP